MIIKGSARGQSARDSARLASHLQADENEAVTILGSRNIGSTDIGESLNEMFALSLGSRTRRPLYHASVSPTSHESRRMTAALWVEAADELERHLDLVGHQRILIQHRKRGRVHLHIVWNRVHPDTLRVAHDGWSYARHEACARALEKRWRLQPVIGVHTRSKGTKRPIAAFTHRDHQAERRTGVSVAEVSAALRHAWASAIDGRSFAAAVHLAGLTLARGRRGIVAVDRAGVPHSLPRRIGLKATEVRRRLSDLDITTLPTVENPVEHQSSSSPRSNTMPKQQRYSAARPSAGIASRSRPILDPDYWKHLGFQVHEVAGLLLVILSNGITLEDRGDEMTICGFPTPAATAAMVAAARARNWEGVHFSGGDAAWQRAARIEAIRQGFPANMITLECEKTKPPVGATVPNHIKRRIAPDPVMPAEIPESEQPDPAPAAPSPGNTP